MMGNFSRKIPLATLLAALMATGGAGAATAAPTPDPSPVAQKSISKEEAQKMRENAGVDTSALDKAIKDATDKGLTVNQDGKCTLLPTSLEDLNAQKDKLSKDYAAQTKTIQDGTAKYLADKAAYDKLVDDQLKNADPKQAISPDQLAVEDGLESVSNPNSLVKPPGWQDLKKGEPIIDPDTGKPVFVGDDSWYYNSDSAQYIMKSKVKAGDSYVVEWKGIKKDKKNGRLVNVKVTLSDIVLSAEGDKAADNYDPTVPYIIAYSNSKDDFSTQGIASYSQKPEYFYADTGEPYTGYFYETVGSLNAQGSQGERYEFTTPGPGVVASFKNPNSLISTTLLPLSGASKGGVPGGAGFMIPPPAYENPRISDESPDAINKIGVTYLMKNGAKYFVGVSGTNGQPAQQVLKQDGNVDITATYMHALISSITVAPTAVEPKKPIFDVKKCQIVVPEPQKFDFNESFEDINKKEVKAGDVINYTLVNDTTALVNSTPPVTKSGMVDKYDTTKGKVLLDKVKVIQLPQGTKNDQASIAQALKTKLGKDVTESFTVTDKKDKGLFIEMNKVGDKLALPMGFLYVTVMPYEVTTKDAGKIENTAAQIINDYTVDTEKVENPVPPPPVPPTPTPTPSPTPSPTPAPVPPGPQPTNPPVVNPAANPGNPPAPQMNPAGAPAPQSSSPVLAYTGANGLWIAGAAAALLLLVGISAVVRARRKKAGEAVTDEVSGS